MRQVINDIHAKISAGTIPDKEADVWKAVVAEPNEAGDRDDSTTTQERPLARDLDVGDHIRKAGYAFSTAYVFAPCWTTPLAKGASKLRLY